MLLFLHALPAWAVCLPVDDHDSDSFCSPEDCDNADSAINPEAPEDGRVDW